MRNRVVIVYAAMLALMGCVSPGPTSTVAITENGYALIWQDEFNEDGAPNPDHWGYETGFVRNKELQWYQAENAYISDGKLIVEAKRKQKPNPKYVPNSEYWQASRRSIRFTSASLTTRGLLAWQYGRFEVRAKIPTENGLWPVVWFMGKDGLWPAGGEIDLMEFYDSNLLANVAWAGNRDGSVTWDIASVSLSRLGDEHWDDDFHTWRMDWDAEGISLFLDGRRLNHTSLSSTLNAPGIEPANPFLHPQFMLISLAIGGTQGGNPRGTTFPSQLEVDYVRVYQKKTN